MFIVLCVVATVTTIAGRLLVMLTRVIVSARIVSADIWIVCVASWRVVCIAWLYAILLVRSLSSVIVAAAISHLVMASVSTILWLLIGLAKARWKVTWILHRNLTLPIFYIRMINWLATRIIISRHWFVLVYIRFWSLVSKIIPKGRRFSRLLLLILLLTSVALWAIVVRIVVEMSLIAIITFSAAIHEWLVIVWQFHLIIGVLNCFARSSSRFTLIFAMLAHARALLLEVNLPRWLIITTLDLRATYRALITTLDILIVLISLCWAQIRRPIAA